MEDAGIIITPQQYIDRVIWHEKFIADNPDFILLKNCKAYKKAYLTYLLTGIDNTSLYDYDDETKLIRYDHILDTLLSFFWHLFCYV